MHRWWWGILLKQVSLDVWSGRSGDFVNNSLNTGWGIPGSVSVRMKFCISWRPHWVSGFGFWTAVLYKGSPPLESPPLWSTRVQAKSLLMDHPGKRWVKDSIRNFRIPQILVRLWKRIGQPKPCFAYYSLRARLATWFYRGEKCNKCGDLW